MGRAIDMEKNIDGMLVRLKRLEKLVEMLEKVNSVAYSMADIEENKKEKANGKGVSKSKRSSKDKNKAKA
tara:strand:- start:547 stop:756 length:210 start_codon:yes stop_codon:yes gene_type:complete